MRYHNYFHDIFVVGIFLGYSLLQVLEYGVAAIVTPMIKCHDNLSKRFSNSNRELQSASPSSDDSQDKLENYENNCGIIELESKTIPGTCIDCEQKFKVIEQEMREMKNELEDMKRQNDTTSNFASHD